MSRENTNNSHELGRDEVIKMGDKLSNKNSSKSLFLASRLSGVLVHFWMKLVIISSIIMNLVEALISIYASVNRAEVFRSELQTSVQMGNDTIPELAQSI